MSTNSKIAFAVQQSFKDELRKHIIQGGYGFRGKSKWISEAVESLLLIKDYPALISYNDEMYGFDKIETAVIDYSLKLKIEKAIIHIRKEFPTMEGVKSRILRTAIMQRILRS